MTVEFLIELFFGPKFRLHRVLGLVFLLQWAAALFLYFYDYDMFYNSPLVWSLPFSGLAQSIVATMTFTFLPKKQIDPGYYSDKSTLSYNFVKENIYFAGLLFFQWLYMHDTYRQMIKDYVPYVIESTMVFLPYVIIRPFFPKTSFRASLDISEKNKSEKNRIFFIAVTWITKIFYVWAKHFIGFFLNYARFLDRIPPVLIRHIYLMLIMSSAATTISMFLHTLKFKKYIGPRTSYLWYMSSYLATFYSWVRIMDVFYLSFDLSVLTLVGVVLNFSIEYLQISYQVFLLGLLNLFRDKAISGDVSSLFLAMPT